MAFKVGTGGDFEADPVSPGIHDAVVAEVYDLGPRYSQWRDGEKVHQGFFVLQTEEVRTDGQFAGQPKELWKFFNVKAGISSKSALGKFLEGWRGRPFSAEELSKIEKEQYDLEEKCVGKCLQVLVTHSLSTSGKTRAKIEAALPPNKVVEHRLKVRDYTTINKREQLDLNALFGRPAEAEEVAESAAASHPPEYDDVPF